MRPLQNDFMQGAEESKLGRGRPREESPQGKGKRGEIELE